MEERRIGSVDQEQFALRPAAGDRKSLWRSESEWNKGRGAFGVFLRYRLNSRRQQSQLHEIAAVQWKIPNLIFAYRSNRETEPTDSGRSDPGRRAAGGRGKAATILDVVHFVGY